MSDAGGDDPFSRKRISKMRTYTLYDYEVKNAEGAAPGKCYTRALQVTVGSQALEPDEYKPKTLIRFEAIPVSTMEREPRMQVRVVPGGDSAEPIVFDDAAAVQIIFDNRSFLSEMKEMPFWLIDCLEFAATKLRQQYDLNQNAGLNNEDLD